MRTTVGDLIRELEKHDKTQRVILYKDNKFSISKQDGKIGCVEEEIFNEDDGIVEKVISLYEY